MKYLFRYHLPFRICGNVYYDPPFDFWIAGLFSKHRKSLIIQFMWFNTEAIWQDKRWWIIGQEMRKGKTYEVWHKNPEFNHEEVLNFSISKDGFEHFKMAL